MPSNKTYSESDRLLDSSNASDFRAQDAAFRTAYHAIAWIQALTVPVLLAGQTLELFDYDLAESYGLQEPREEVGPAIVQVNRAFGTADTIVLIPTLMTSAYGLFRKKRWSLICAAASGGIHCYWTIVCTFMFLFLGNNDVEGYTHEPPLEVWSFMLFYFVYGTLVLGFLYHYWDLLVVVTD